MCLSALSKHQIIRLPDNLPESFPAADINTRGNASWKTLFSSEMSAGIACCPPKGNLGLHKHTQAEVYYILSGRGTVLIEGQHHVLEPGMTVLIPGDAEHGVSNEGSEDFRWLYVFPGRFEDVVYRFRNEGRYPVGTDRQVHKAKL